MRRAEKNRILIIDYLGDPENPFLSRAELSVSVLGYKNKRTIYDNLSPTDLDKIEAEAFELRKERSVRQQSQIYGSLYKKAVDGDVPAAKEWLDRVAGKVTEKVDVNLSGKLTLAEAVRKRHEKK